MTKRAGKLTLSRLGRFSVASASLLTLIGCGSDDGGGGGGKPTPPAPIVNLVADANRNGLLETAEGTDEIGEEKWSSEAGGVYLVNLDDDDGDGKADNTDEIVNGPADEADLARFAVAAWPDVPETASGTVTFDPDSRTHVRVFRKTPTGWVKVDTGTPIALTAIELKDNIEFGIEGLDFIRKVEQPWQGLFKATLSVTDSKTGPVGTNSVELRQSPWLANHNLRPFDKVYYSDFSPRLTESFPEPLGEFGLQIRTFPDNKSDPDGWTDIWFEDWMQTGYTEMPAVDGVHGMVIFNPRPWGRDGNTPVEFLRAHMLGPDSGVAVFVDEKTGLGKGTTFDSHGNHDALPPYPAYPAGRIFTGSNVFSSTREFYAAQQAQPPLALKTDWLIVGHIDETYAPVRAATPTGFKLLQNTPSLGRQLFQDWEKQGNGSAVVFEGLYDFDGKLWQTTVAGINSDPELQAWNQEAQVNIDDMHEQLLTDGPFAEDDIVPVPVLYEEVDGGKIAYLPDTANVRVVNEGNVTIFPKSQGPIINGEDAFRKWLETYLTDPKLKLGKDGNGPTIRYGDSWDYHVLLGDIHCASNWTALPTKDEPRWWEGVK